MKTYSDPDGGSCDDCGSTEGQRHRRTRVVTTRPGGHYRIVVWLCDECLAEPLYG